jgi:hypothetical protein
MQAAVLKEATVMRPRHPNDLDRKRIERALAHRKRYRYVSPAVLTVTDGYRIESPCCSRNIDREGGVVDVALMIYDADIEAWQLFYKDHEKNVWEHHSSYERLVDLLDLLNVDAERKFWQ